MSLALIVASSGTQQGNPLSLLLLPLMFVAMYFMIIRPQRRRQKATAALQSNLSEGDEVITTSGVYGFITGFENDIVWLEVDDNVQIRVARAAIQRKVDTAATTGSATASTSIESLTEGDETNNT